MAKRKRNSPSWLKRELDKRLYYPAILFTLLLCVIFAFAYSSPGVGIPIESNVQNYFRNNYIDFIQSLTPIPKPKGKIFIGAGSDETFPPRNLTPQPTPIANLPYLTFSKLIIYQFSYSTNIKKIANIINNTATPTRIITDPATIEKLYDDIRNLPPWPSGKQFNCPNIPDNASEYVLNFYQNNTLTIHALVQPSGCPGVGLAHYEPRIGGAILFKDLQQTLNLSNQEFYGY